MTSEHPARKPALSDPHKFWEDRHRKFGADLRSVGNAMYSHEDNARLISEKAVVLANLLGVEGKAVGCDVLDAGCGQGFFTELLAAAGFNCVGVDVSETAIAAAHSHYGTEYHCSALEEISLGRRFDAVLCLDVLYHILEDEKWMAVLENLVNHTAGAGRIFIVENFENTVQTARHCKWRTAQAYEAAADRLGCTILRHHSYVASVVGATKTALVLARK